MKIRTHLYRNRQGIVLPYYTSIVEPLPCGYCTGQKKVSKLLKPKEKNA